MSKPLQTVCLAAAGLLAIGTFMVVDKGEAGSARRQQAPTSAASALPPQVSLTAAGEPIALPAPTQDVLALQRTKSDAKAAGPGASASDAGWIGVMFEDDKHGHGVKVKDVFPGGPAAFAGLRVGDVLIKMDKAALDSPEAAAAAIEHHSPKQQASLTIQRGKRTLELKVSVESLSEFNGRYVREMMRRDPRDPKFAEHHGVSEADVQVELVRRLFEQNQRQETLLHEIRQELQSLRTELHGRSK